MANIFEPTQITPKTTRVDPFEGVPEFDALRQAIFARRPSAPFSPEGVDLPGLNEAQAQAARATTRAIEGAEPLYGTGVGTLQRTASGGFLSPLSTPEYQRLEARTTDVARNLFDELSGSVANQSALRGAFYSSARARQQADVGRRLSADVARDLAQRAFGQYGAERGLQQQAAIVGAQLSPALAQQLFGQGSALRNQELEGQRLKLSEQEIELRAYLANQGLNEQQINNMMRFVLMSRPELIQPLVGPSPGAQTLDALNTGARVASAVGSFF